MIVVKCQKKLINVDLSFWLGAAEFYTFGFLKGFFNGGDIFLTQTHWNNVKQENLKMEEKNKIKNFKKMLVVILEQ